LVDLVGGAIAILKNMKVNGKDDIPYMKWKIKNVPNHQPVYDWLVGVELPDTNRYQWDNWRDDPLSGWQGGPYLFQGAFI